MKDAKLHFWFEAIALSKERQPSTTEETKWMYLVGEGENTPVAMVAGRNEYEACARARLVCAALNQAAIVGEMVAAKMQ